MTPYSIIFKKFLSLLKNDPIYAELDPAIAEDDMLDLLDAAIMDFEYPRVDLKDKDDTLMQFNNELGFDEIQILAFLMSVWWLRRQINAVDLMSPGMTPQEFKTFSSANQLNAIDNALKMAEQKAMTLRLAYSRRDGNRSALYKLGGD
jgi:hypothetical protein